MWGEKSALGTTPCEPQNGHVASPLRSRGALGAQRCAPHSHAAKGDADVATTRRRSHRVSALRDAADAGVGHAGMSLIVSHAAMQRIARARAHLPLLLPPPAWATAAHIAATPTATAQDAAPLPRRDLLDAFIIIECQPPALSSGGRARAGVCVGENKRRSHIPIHSTNPGSKRHRKKCIQL
jgi:hypothetical protein